MKQGYKIYTIVKRTDVDDDETSVVVVVMMMKI